MTPEEKLLVDIFGNEEARAAAADIAPEHVSRCDAVTDSGVPCQKHGPHAGHWFMTDDLWACMSEDHFDAANVLSLTPLVHLDVPCPRFRGAEVTHLGNRANAENCPACEIEKRNLAYPFLCPEQTGAPIFRGGGDS